MKEIEQIKLEHDCGCEVCSTVSQVCPATASSYAQEILTLRSTIASLQRELSQLKPGTFECLDCGDIIDGVINDRGHQCPEE